MLINTPRHQLTALFNRKKIHYGWLMVILAFTHSMFSAAAMGVPSVLIVPMAEDLGWTIGELSAPQGLRLALFGLCAPLAGGLMLRYGPLKMIRVSGFLLIIGLFISIFTTEKWHLWLGMGILLGIAPGLTAMQLGSVIASRWFAQRQGLVIGILSGAVATGTLIFMPVAAWISDVWNWRVALALPTTGSLLSLSAFLLLAFDRPQEINLPAYGEDEIKPTPPAYTENFVFLSFRALKIGSRSYIFWILALSFAICGISSFGLTQAHLVPFCGDLGVPFAAAAWLLAVIGVCDLIGTIGSGWLSDRYDNRLLLLIYYGFRGVALIWLVSTDPTFVGLTIFAVVYGLDFIATVPPTVKLSIAKFGTEMGPAIFAWVFAAHHVAAGLMTVFTGISRDLIGSYIPAFTFAGLVCFVAAVSFMMVSKVQVENRVS